MPTLRWSKRPGDVESNATDPSSSQSRMRLKVTLSQDDARALREALEDIQQRPTSELRLEISPEWTLFWKLREGESRILSAHPEENAWVGTVALVADDLVTFLGALSSGMAFTVNRLFAVSSVSNLELSFAPGA